MKQSFEKGLMDLAIPQEKWYDVYFEYLRVTGEEEMMSQKKLAALDCRLDEITRELTNIASRIDSIERAQRKSWSRVIKGTGIAVAAALAIIVTVLLVFYLPKKSDDEPILPDDPPNNFTERFIDRPHWFAKKPNTPFQTFPSLPLSSVSISTTDQLECQSHVFCPNAVWELQARYKAAHLSDIPSNFILADDGYIYEGRGWNYVGENIPGYDNTTLEIQYLGFFDQALPKRRTNESLFMLLEEGVKLGVLSPDYRIYGKYQFLHLVKPPLPLYDDMEKNWIRWYPTIPAREPSIVNQTTDS